MKEPWSKQHKREFKHCHYSLSNSFAQPLTHQELIAYTQASEHPDRQHLIDLYQNHSLEYTPNGGSLDLRRDIAKVVYNDRIPPENVLVFPGGQVAIQTASLALARNCHSIVFVPGYQSTVESPEWAANSTITKIPRSPKNDWQIDPNQLRAAIRPDTKYLILNEPYNPGGIVMGNGLQQEIIGICKEHDIVILCDEVYRLLEHDDDANSTKTNRIPPMATAYQNGISAVTMSKPWGGCGITIGWLASSNSTLIQKLIDVQYFATACPSRASEIQARMVLASSDLILRDRMEIIRKNKKLLTEFIEVEFKEWFEWCRPNAGAIAFVKFKGPWDSEDLGKHLAVWNDESEDGKVGISIKPAYCFMDGASCANRDLKDYFRVGFGEKKMPSALEALRRFVEEHEGEWR